MDEVEVVAIKAKRIGGKAREIGERFTLKRRDARAAMALKFVTAAAPEEADAETRESPEEPDMPNESLAAAPDSAQSQPEVLGDDAKAIDAAVALEDKQMSAERVKRPYKRRDLQAQP